MVGICIVDADVIELRDGQINLMHPSRAAILAAPQSAVVSGINNVGVAGVDPHGMEVSVGRTGDRAEALSPIHAVQQDEIGLEDLLWIFGIDDQVGEVKRTPYHELT